VVSNSYLDKNIEFQVQNMHKFHKPYNIQHDLGANKFRTERKNKKQCSYRKHRELSVVVKKGLLFPQLFILPQAFAE
jgi:hypothetical protein